MWDYNWVMADAACRLRTNCGSDKAGQGRFYQEAGTAVRADFRGMVQIMKDYITSSNRAFT